MHAFDRRTDGQTAFHELTAVHLMQRGNMKERKLRVMTSRVCAQATHVALPPPKLRCGVGPWA